MTTRPAKAQNILPFEWSDFASVAFEATFRSSPPVRKTTSSPARELLANNLIRLRAERGLSQEELAFLTGVHRTYMSALERRRRNATIDVLHKIAVALDLPFKALFEDSTHPQTEKATPNP